MADWEKLGSELSNLADSMKLTIGESTEIRREIDRIAKNQQRLKEIHNQLNEELESEKNKNMFFGVLKFIAPLASIFIPGGLFVDALIKAGSTLLADKFGSPEQALSLEDIIQRIASWIEWGDTLKEIAETILSDSKILRYLDGERKSSRSLIEQVRQLDESLKIHLKFDTERVINKQIKQIKLAQDELKQIQPKLNNLIRNLEQNVELNERIKALLFFFGNSAFAIEWIDEEAGLIISYGGQVTALGDIFNECVSLKQTIDSLFSQANNLRGQAEQSIRYLEKEGRSRKAAGRQAAHRSDRRPVQTLLAASIVAVLGFVGWKTGFQFPQVQQMSANQGISLNIEEQNQNPEQKPASQPLPKQEQASQPNTEQNQTSTNLETAQNLAMEAAVLTQNPPHPLEVWQQATAKWKEAVTLLEAVPENTPISAQAKAKLTAYRTNYTALSNRLITEQKAAANLEAAEKLAWEAAVIVQKPPHPIEVWQNAQSKLQQALSLLQAIPQGTFVEAKAKEKLATYRTNYEAIASQIKAAQENEAF